MKRAAGDCPPVGLPKRDKIDVLAVASKSPADAEAALVYPSIEWATRFAVYLRALPAGTWELMDLEFDDYMALYCVSRAVQRVVPLLIDWKRYALAQPHVSLDSVQGSLWAKWFAFNDNLPWTASPVLCDPQYRAFDTLRRALVLQDVCFTADGPRSACGGCYRWEEADLTGRCIQYAPAQWVGPRGCRTKRCFNCWHRQHEVAYAAVPHWVSTLARHSPMYCTRYFGMSSLDVMTFGEKEEAWTADAEERVQELRETDPGALEIPDRIYGLPPGRFRISNSSGTWVYRVVKRYGSSPVTDGYLFMMADVERYYRKLAQYVLSAKAGYPRERAERLASQIDLKAFRLARDWKSLQEHLKVQTALLVASRTAGPLHDDTNEQLAVFRQ